MRLRISIALALALGAQTGTAHAEPVADAYGPGLVKLSIVDPQSGKTLRVFHHHHRYFIAGTASDRYVIRITNTTADRVLAILTVDGVNITTGETGAFGQHGPLLEGFETRDIPGWLKSTNEVAAFRFAAIADSYAASTGRPANVGVIGMALFQEKPAPPPPPQAWIANEADAEIVVTSRTTGEDNAEPVARRSRSSAPSPSAPPMPSPTRPMSAPIAQPTPERLGTAHGEAMPYAARWVTFDRASASPVAVRFVEYDSLQNLIARHVLHGKPTDTLSPQPFPGAGNSTQWYVPDPPKQHEHHD